MGLISWVRSVFTGGKPRQQAVTATYDAAQSGSDNANHWAWADSLNANTSNSPDVRKTLRERARYECDNNGYAGGLIDKLGNDLIGTCPRIQVNIPGEFREASRRIEKAFTRWAKAVDLGRKLRLLDNAAVRDGEGFAILINNPALPTGQPQLDLKLYECDQVETPFRDYTDPLGFSGGRLDKFGNVVEWHFLKAHPGSEVWANYLDFEAIPAANVLHWFKPRRAGQIRGIPEITSSLSLYAILRRYTLATLGAAELAASIAGVLETDAPVGTEDAPTFDTMDEIDIPRRGLLTLPGGYRAKGFEGSQPIQSYREFKAEILTEAGQPVGSPRNVATGSSAEYNYSSGRLDYGIYQRGLRVRRYDLSTRILDQIFHAWLDEAALIPGLIPDGLPLRSLWSRDWYFDGFESLDPVKEANAISIKLANNTTTLAEIYAERGLDWEEQIEQRGREVKLLRSMGLLIDADANVLAPEEEPIEQ